MSQYKGLALSLVSQVSYVDVQTYARSTGWERVQNVKGEIAVYHYPEDGTQELIVPLDPDFADYDLRLAEVVATLAEVENRSAQEVLHDLLTSPSDILRFRLDAETAAKGSVPFEIGLGLFEGVRKALLASACSVIQPQAFHPRLSRTEAEEFISQCRIAQTEEGSFTAVFVCPLDTTLSNQGTLFADGETAPFARKVTTTIMQAVNQIVSGIKSESLEPLLHPDEPILVSANLCEALSQMQPQGERSNLYVSSTWSRTTAPPPDVPSQVRIPKEYFSTIEEISRKLRPKREPERSSFVGKIAELRGEPGEQNRMQGEIILAFIPEDDELLKAEVSLNSKDYTKACDAHKETKYVQLGGILHRSSRIHTIHEYQKFRVIS